MLRLVGFFLGASVLALGIGQGLLRAYSTPQGADPAGVAPTSPSGRAALAAQPGPQAVALAADAQGHFIADVKINGLFIKGLVDTGATTVAIPGDVARTLGIVPRPEDYTVRVATANGETMGARIRLGEVRISTIVVRDVEGVVVPNGLPTTLIGMSFIRRLGSEMRGNTLVLRQ